jgi:hypothetical protein
VAARRAGATTGDTDDCCGLNSCDSPLNVCSIPIIRLLRHVFDKNTSLKNSEERRRTQQVLGRIIEHQQNSRDFFFLHPEPKKIEEDSVVDLRVMLSLNNVLHYRQQIVNSKCISMNEIYAANLGWMAGNVFARIAMPALAKVAPPNRIRSSQDRGILPELTALRQETKLAGPTNAALGLIEFPPLADYDLYREKLMSDADAEGIRGCQLLPPEMRGSRGWVTERGGWHRTHRTHG